MKLKVKSDFYHYYLISDKKISVLFYPENICFAKIQLQAFNIKGINKNS
jgi:hypothetical protein